MGGAEIFWRGEGGDQIASVIVVEREISPGNYKIADCCRL